MSKEAALRAMREARYAARTTGSSTAARPASPAVRPAATQSTRSARPTEAAAAPAPTDGPTEEVCGHRSMNGRTCTREQGHAAKSHRYS